LAEGDGFVEFFKGAVTNPAPHGGMVNGPMRSRNG
jgi:hypothetical protein